MVTKFVKLHALRLNSCTKGFKSLHARHEWVWYQTIKDDEKKLTKKYHSYFSIVEDMSDGEKNLTKNYHSYFGAAILSQYI